MEFLSDIGSFVLKAAIIVIAIMIVIGAIANSAQKQKGDKGELRIKDVSKALREQADEIKLKLMSKNARKKAEKIVKKARKNDAKKTADELPKRVFVVTFRGSMDAKEVAQLTHEVNAIIAVATDQDEAFIRLESPGGVVHGYGLGAAQLQRLRDHGMRVTVSVDKVAASGGYMMACVGHHILSAPFAYIGSIGVIGQLPNFHRWLKKHDIDFEQQTAGDYKRSLTVFGENTDADRIKFKEDLENIHQQFKAHVASHRTEVDIDKVATGEVWTGQEALTLHLVDEIKTGDAWLLQQAADRPIYKVEYQVKKGLGERFGKHMTATLRAVKEFVSQR